jgi:hypothetical protein
MPTEPWDIYDGPESELWKVGQDPAWVQMFLKNHAKRLEVMINTQEQYIKYRKSKLHNRLPQPVMRRRQPRRLVSGVDGFRG